MFYDLIKSSRECIIYLVEWFLVIEVAIIRTNIEYHKKINSVVPKRNEKRYIYPTSESCLLRCENLFLLIDFFQIRWSFPDLISLLSVSSTSGCRNSIRSDQVISYPNHKRAFHDRNALNWNANFQINITGSFCKFCDSKDTVSLSRNVLRITFHANVCMEDRSLKKKRYLLQTLSTSLIYVCLLHFIAQNNLNLL